MRVDPRPQTDATTPSEAVTGDVGRTNAIRRIVEVQAPYARRWVERAAGDALRWLEWAPALLVAICGVAVGMLLGHAGDDVVRAAPAAIGGLILAFVLVFAVFLLATPAWLEREATEMSNGTLARLETDHQTATKALQAELDRLAPLADLDMKQRLFSSLLEEGSNLEGEMPWRPPRDSRPRDAGPLQLKVDAYLAKCRDAVSARAPGYILEAERAEASGPPMDFGGADDVDRLRHKVSEMRDVISRVARGAEPK